MITGLSDFILDMDKVDICIDNMVVCSTSRAKVLIAVWPEIVVTALWKAMLISHSDVDRLDRSGWDYNYVLVANNTLDASMDRWLRALTFMGAVRLQIDMVKD